MKIKSAGRVGFLFIVASLFMMSAAYVVAITDLQLPATGSSQARADDGKKPSFISNSIMVKLTPQARASLKVSGQEVNPRRRGWLPLTPSSLRFSLQYGQLAFCNEVTRPCLISIR